MSLEILPRPRTKQGRALKSLWPNMRRKEPPRSRRDGQTKLKIQSHRSSIKSNRILKIIMLLCHIHLTDRLLHGFGRILIVTHLQIIVGCICNYIIFNILLCIQVVPRKRPIVASNNLVKRDFCSKESEKNVKQDSKYLQSRWCRSGLSHTQKRRLQ